MPITVQEALHYSTVTALISRYKTPLSRLQQFWGMQDGGPAVNPVGGRTFTWDIFDRTRAIAHGRAPATGPGTASPQKIGIVNANAYRAHEKIHMCQDRITRTRPLGGQWGMMDVRGETYVAKQAGHLAQRFKNNKEFMISRMMRGGFDILQDGDDWIPVDIGDGQTTVNFGIPAGNLDQLDMLGDGDIIDASWSVTTTNIHGHLLAINAANEQLHGWPLRHVWCSSVVYGYVANNETMIAPAGTANTVFNSFRPSGVIGPDGVEDTGLEVVFRAIPWITWHIYDGGLVVNGTYVKFFPDDVACFCPDPSSDIAEYLEGSEVVAENVMDPGREAYGTTAWTTRVIDPAGFDLKALHNGLPALYVPRTIQYATIVLPL